MDIDEILHTAIKIEEEGIKYYTKSAEKVEDQNGKAILLFLAHEEGRHRKFFSEMLKKHGSGEKTLKLLMVPRIFPKEHELEEGKATGIDEGILEHAQDVEKRSIDFYSDAFRAVSDKDLRAGLETVIHEEKQHLEWLEYLMSTVGAHEYWGGLQDHFSLDG